MFGENIVPVDRPAHSQGPAKPNPGKSNNIGLGQRTISVVSAVIALGIGFLTYRAQISHIIKLEEMAKESYLFDILPLARLEYREFLDAYRNLALFCGFINTWVPGTLSGVILIGIRHVSERQEIRHLAGISDSRCTLLLRPFAVDGVEIQDFPVERQESSENLLHYWFVVFVLNLVSMVLLGQLSRSMNSFLVPFVLSLPVSMVFMVLMARYLSRWILSRRKITVPERLGLPIRRKLGTFIAFGGPQYQASSLGPSLLICPEATWRTTLRRTLERSKCVLIVLGDTPASCGNLSSW